MSPHDGGVHADPFEVGLFGQDREDIGQHTAGQLIIVAALGGSNLAQALGQLLPAPTGPGHPEDGIQEQPVVRAWATFALAPAWHQRRPPRPLRITQNIGVARHRHRRLFEKPP